MALATAPPEPPTVFPQKKDRGFYCFSLYTHAADLSSHKRAKAARRATQIP